MTTGFLSNFKYESVWDVVFPISYPIYYDIWALKEKIIAPRDIVSDTQHRIPSVIGNFLNLMTLGSVPF